MTRCSGVAKAKCDAPCEWIVKKGCKSSTSGKATKAAKAEKPKKSRKVLKEKPKVAKAKKEVFYNALEDSPNQKPFKSATHGMTDGNVNKLIQTNQYLRDDITTLQKKLNEYIKKNQTLKQDINTVWAKLKKCNDKLAASK